MQERLKSLFLRQSYQDNWEDYQRSLHKSKFPKWDYIILTASNEEQAAAYRKQIDYRLSNNLLPKSTHYAVLPDPNGKRVGSGGATLNVLKYIKETSMNEDCFQKLRILVIHSGGDSKRVPQYSACGKLFSPVPRELPNGYRSTLFDEFIIGMSGVPSRIQNGMLVLSGDVLLLFNALQIDFSGESSACISIKENVEIGKNHGVFLGDNNNYVGNFLHKMSVEKLKEVGAVNEKNNVNLDTGAVLFNGEILEGLFSLISIDNKTVDIEKFNKFVNDTVKISFYADFLYPLATNSTLEQYYKEIPEGNFSPQLTECRTQIWNVLSKYKMKLISLSPAEFIHFGTTKELLSLMTQKLSNYYFLDWRSQIISNIDRDTNFACNNVFIDEKSNIGVGSYIEDSYIINGATIGNNCVISNITLNNITIPDDVVLHCLKLKDGKFIVRIYGINDNPKDILEKDGQFMGIPIEDFLSKNNLTISDIWNTDEHYLWFANLYKPCDTIEQSLKFALNIYDMVMSKGDVDLFKTSNRMSLYSSFNYADVNSIIGWHLKLSDKVRAYKFIQKVRSNASIEVAKKVFGDNGINSNQSKILSEYAEITDFSTKIRIYYYLSKIMDNSFHDELETKCFQIISDTIAQSSLSSLNFDDTLKISKDNVKINFPVRVNWGGGWSDTPPYCNEHGGTVLNASIKLNGKLPIEVCIKKIEKKSIVLESVDSGQIIEITDVKDIQNCNNPYDPYSLHKSALLTCGIIPINEDIPLTTILDNLGSGFYLSTRVIDIPRGSGLGTSSILAGACIKAIFEFMGKPITDSELFDRVLIMEQIMSTGGGWQDQVGGVTNGIKFITTDKGLKQNIKCEKIVLSQKTLEELEERFVLIYTGQRRLARNILREVVGKYIGGNETSISVLNEIQKMACLMRFELEKGNIDNFADLLNQHWELSKKLDSGCTNTCIDQIFLSIDDLISGKMICGAGGGGFLQVVLKKGVSVEQLHNRLYEVFQDTGVDVWTCEFI
ncbi:MAG: L-fucokinase [Oscillospiraceae bacterium]